MIIQNLIIYKYNSLYHILEELGLELNFKVAFSDSKNSLYNEIKKHSTSIIISNKKYPDIGNQLVLENTPINIFKLVEKINIEFLKLNFKDKSNYKIGNYKIDLNSKNILKDKKTLKLTEKEISTILYLSKFKKPISIKELQLKVWDHKSILETHTVETHIHRLKKKIKEEFDDEEFIVSLKEGYLIN